MSLSNGLKQRPNLQFVNGKSWESDRLGNLMISRNEKQIPSEDAPLMAFVAESGVVPKGDRYDRSFLVKSDAKLYKRTELNDFIYSSNNLDVGSIGLNKYGSAVISDVYEIFYIKQPNNPTFISELIQRPSCVNKILKYRQGCLYGQYRIYAEDFLNVDVMLPHVGEQEKIASFIELIDSKINKQQQLIELLKKYKRSLIYNIMDRKFKVYNNGNEWEMTTFGNVADYKKGPFGSALKKEIFVPKSLNSVKIYEQQNAISKDWRLERYFITNEYANKLKGFEVKGGDIIVSCAGTIGELYTLPSEAECGIINQALMRIRTNDEIVDKRFFIHCFVLMIDNFSKKYSNGSAIKNIPPFADLKAAEFPLPSLEIQNKISNFIELIENKVVNEQHKLDELILLKKSLLQQLFI